MDAQSLRTLGIHTDSDCNIYTLLTSGENNCKAVRVLRDAIAEYNATVPTEKTPIRNALEAAGTIRNILKGIDHEECWILYCNKAQKLVCKKKIATGTSDSVMVDAKSIAKEMLFRNANNAILVHNHPSGDSHPSVADIRMTEELRKKLNVLDLNLVDHVIVTDTEYFSFLEDKIQKFN